MIVQPNEEYILNKFLQKLKSYGAKIDNEDENNIRKILTSEKIIDIDRRELAKYLGIDYENEELMKRISLDDEFFELHGELLKPFLLKNIQEIFLTNQIQIIQNQKVNIDGDFINLVELCDCEIEKLNNEEVRNIVGEILYDKSIMARQGFFWNVLISKNSPYVLKAERKLKNKGEEHYKRRTLLRYPIIRKILDREFLPKQIVLHTEDKERLFILQEKIPIEKMISITDANVNQFILGNYGKAIRESLRKPNNRKKLRKFIDGAMRLYKEKGLILDLVGSNLFFSVESEKLEIKIVDLGCFEKHLENSDVNIKKSLDVIKVLQELL
jgi:hypothetical protein